MIESIDAQRYRVQFDSLYEVVNWIKATPLSTTWRARSSTQNSAEQSWDLNVGFDGALRLAADGWEEGVRKLHALTTAVPNATTFERRYGVAGEIADVPRYLSGDPLHMIHRGKVRKPKPTMTIALNISAVCSTTGQEMWNFGAALVALIDRLEARHVRVEVLAMWGTECNKRYVFSWTVKRAEDTLDLSAVAFALAHPAMLRRIGFAVIERSRMPTDPGYGRPNSLCSAEDFVDAPEGTLFIGGIGMSAGACRTMEGALAFAKAAINKAAGEPIAELEELD